MRINEIRVDELRNLRDITLVPGQRFNLLTGGNGAGKTSLLEALHLLAHGRSFRAGPPDSLIQRGQTRYTLYAEISDDTARSYSLAMQRTREGWILKRNGDAVSTLIEFVRHLAVITIEPESHQLLTGTGEGRRRFLDWLLFHVEQDFLSYWRRYLRALRQRNAALRVPGSSTATIEAWEGELATAGEKIDTYRRSILEQLSSRLAPILDALLSADREVRAHYRRGWPTNTSLQEALAEARTSDRERGFTQRGPHRSDWRLERMDGGQHHQLSRGQAKLLAIACLLAQAELYKVQKGQNPIFACDDLGAELDRAHQGRLLTFLEASGAQTFLTGTEAPGPWQESRPAGTAMFHVEQGRIQPLL